ncbi:MAG: sodium:solute symporter [Planctomycetaceae bacterium]|nr:sodium:solute symporter [Planctomycetaceae bacterium]
MSATLLLIVFIVYTAMLFGIAWLTSRNADQKAFYIGGRKSNWLLVAYGYIGASLTGVTFMSVPGAVSKQNFYYLPLVFGFVFGYSVIAYVLIPLYYRLNLTSIYTYLEIRFGACSYKTGASFFIVSRILGAAIRTCVVIMVLHVFVLGKLGVPLWLVALIFILFAILYTYQGGVKTIVWTDSFQTTFMLLAAIVTIVVIASKLDLSFFQLLGQAREDGYTRFFDGNWESKTNFFKQFIAGVFVPIAMTGLDQGMMQKSLSCQNRKESQKNIMLTIALIVIVNMMFLMLGVFLAIFCTTNEILINGFPINHPDFAIKDADRIFPTVAFDHLGPFVGICFFIGLISAAYPSCANALTSLTTSTCIDLIGLEKKTGWNDNRKKRVRIFVQCIITLLFLGIILAVNVLKNDALINIVYVVASYTYGPLLALYMFGLFTRRKVFDLCVPFICVASPLICFVLEYNNVIGQVISRFQPNSVEPVKFSFGFALLLVNAALTWLGLFCCSRLPHSINMSHHKQGEISWRKK